MFCTANTLEVKLEVYLVTGTKEETVVRKNSVVNVEPGVELTVWLPKTESLAGIFYEHIFLKTR